MSEAVVKREPQASLGNITDFASADKAGARNWRVHAVSHRYRLLDAARELLQDGRVESCLRVPVWGGDGTVEVWKDTKSNHAHLKGVGRCGSVWTCPVCAAKITIGRRDELAVAMALAREKGWYPVHVTFTARHKREDQLLDLRRGMDKAMRKLKSGRWWQENVKVYGIMGTITGKEVTWGHANGWHPHQHPIMFFERMPDLEELEERLYQRWHALLKKQGLDCDRDHGVVVRPGNSAANYIAKWGIENELTSNHKKAKEGHYTPFELLALYEQGEKWAGKLYQEYAAAYKGVSQLRWSPGLRAALEMSQELTDQELAEAEESENSVKVVSLTWEQYQKLGKRRGAIGELLMVAECGDLAVFTWLLYEHNILLDYQ